MDRYRSVTQYSGATWFC